MKKLIFTIGLGVLTLNSFSQEYKEFNTKRILVSNYAQVPQKNNFKLYKDSLVRIIVGGMGTGKIVGTPAAKTVFSANLEVVKGVLESYYYTEENTRIIIVKKKNGKAVITIEAKDTFNGNVTKTMYY